MTTKRQRMTVTGMTVMALAAGSLLGTQLAGALGGALSGVAAAAGGSGRSGGGGGGTSGGGGGGTSGGGGGETGTETTNNLSVPTVFVPDSGSFTVVCGADGTPSDIVMPTGEPSSGFEVDGYYYVQGKNTWQAQCETAAAGTVSASVAWGDNLTGTAKLQVNKPIRVEVALSDDAETTMGGFSVIKLDPSLLDRESAYGTLAELSGGSYSGTPSTPFTSTGVYDSGATLKIYNVATPNSPITNGPASAEINATGAVVYGYNLTVPTDGYYVIEFSAPNVTLSSADSGTLSGNVASLKITVGSPTTEPTTPPTIPPTNTVPSTGGTSTAPSTGSSPETSPASGSSGPATTSKGVGSGVSAEKIARALGVHQSALGKLNTAIATTNGSIHKFHNASVFAQKKHLAVASKLSANVKRLEDRLHSLLQRRQDVVSHIRSLQQSLQNARQG